MAKTGYVYDERYLLHDPGSWHVERSDRLLVIHKRLVISGLWQELICLKPTAAPLEWIEILHDPEYISRFNEPVKKVCRSWTPETAAFVQNLLKLPGWQWAASLPPVRR